MDKLTPWFPTNDKINRPLSAPPNNDDMGEQCEDHTKQFTNGFIPLRTDFYYSEFYENEKKTCNNIPPPISLEDETFLKEFNELKLRKKSEVSSNDEGSNTGSPRRNVNI